MEELAARFVFGEVALHAAVVAEHDAVAIGLILIPPAAAVGARRRPFAAPDRSAGRPRPRDPRAATQASMALASQSP